MKARFGPGSRQEADRPGANKVLPEIRRLLIEGKNVEAEALVNCELPLAMVRVQVAVNTVVTRCSVIFISRSKTGDTNTPVTGYRRELNLNDAVTRVQFRRGDVEFTREMFVSAPDEVMVLRLSANRPGQISCVFSLDRPERFETVADRKEGIAHDRPTRQTVWMAKEFGMRARVRVPESRGASFLFVERRWKCAGRMRWFC